MTSRASPSMPASGSPARYLRQVSKKIARAWSREGSNIFGLRPELAQVADQALRAARLAREADVAPVQDQPVVRVLQVFRRRELEEFFLDRQNILAGRDAGAIGHPEYVRVDRHGGLAERG